ncbi:unnamed protein product [Rotaria magnacalcarata]|uniref:Uncharacterized protein n=1 Tax=Rotaria magnacalcarata TaxID=392030 RepID=A0A816T8G6_9BILA|nr:unnamed protein product [Rotaria magnacalcarata]CAF4594947.1 unnamed protein product [Rotaria magnacalcarata]
MSINNIDQAVPVDLVKHDEMNRNQEKAQKQILIDLSGIFQTGMNAIRRSTGSGKSSSLDLSADRKDPEGFKREILLNDQLQTKDLEYHVGYVVQDDIVSGNLTVKENLLFSDNVRL